MLDAVAAALTGIRGAKSQAKVSMRAELSRGRGHRAPATLAAAAAAEDDLRAAGKITGDLVLVATSRGDRAAGHATLAETA